MVRMLLSDDRTKTTLRDRHGWTPLQSAIRAHHGTATDGHNLDIVELLIGRHDVDERLLNLTGWRGRTLLHNAAVSGYCCLVQQLLKFGSLDPNIREPGCKATPVLMAAMEGQTKTSLLLLRSSKVTLTPDDMSRLIRIATDRECREIQIGLRSKLTDRNGRHTYRDLETTPLTAEVESEVESEVEYDE
ncbi:hypothetical protein K4F52_010346 [Lecanicillium sp. MT-2017a]|nr:hypothetical protein K4F52_010346 [Lecanicillium sp. MT-2017a]